MILCFLLTIGLRKSPLEKQTMLFHFVKQFTLILVGQNKNKYTMGYFMWRIMTGQSTKIEFLMQTPGMLNKIAIIIIYYCCLAIKLKQSPTF